MSTKPSKKAIILELQSMIEARQVIVHKTAVSVTYLGGGYQNAKALLALADRPFGAADKKIGKWRVSRTVARLAVDEATRRIRVADETDNEFGFGGNDGDILGAGSDGNRALILAAMHKPQPRIQKTIDKYEYEHTFQAQEEHAFCLDPDMPFRYNRLSIVSCDKSIENLFCTNMRVGNLENLAVGPVPFVTLFHDVTDLPTINVGMRLSLKVKNFSELTISVKFRVIGFEVMPP